MISERGSLQQIPPMQLLLTAFERDLSGTIYIKREDVLKILYFSHGRFIGAISNEEEDKLETLLVARGLIPQDDIDRISEEVNISESMGGVLVERGLVSVEQLTEVTREQLHQIVMAILSLEDGSYQLVEEAPPGRMISLDVSVLHLVFEFIRKNLDSQTVLKRIGSLDSVLSPNPDSSKVQKYNLNETQQSLLKRFDGQKKVADILGGFSESHREALLKIVFFFLNTDLLIQNGSGEKHGDVDGANSAASEEEFIRSDRFQRDEDAPAPAPEMPEEREGKRFFRDRIMLEKKSRKQFAFIFVLVILILIVAGVIMLLMLPEDQPEQGDEPANNQIVEVSEPEPVSGKIPGDPVSVTMEKVEDGSGEQAAPNNREEKTQEAAPVAEDTSERQPQTQPERPETREPDDRVPQKKAADYFQQGDYPSAADAWRKELAESGVAFTILLELDCMKESVLNAYNRLEERERFFILKRMLDGRTCFLVCWGRFSSRSEAERQLRRIPQYFWQQQSPPRVMSLTADL